MLIIKQKINELEMNIYETLSMMNNHICTK